MQTKVGHGKRKTGKMPTTRILLQMPLAMKRELKIVAERERKPVAWLIRDAVATTLERRRGRIDWDHDPIRELRGYIKKDGAPPDLSEHIDDFLYGPRANRV